MTKILLVDDEPQMVGFLERLFADPEYSTISAFDGMTAVREFFTARPDIAVVDLMMPHMDGFELCQRIREISHIPIIVLTALEQVGEKVNAFNAGTDDYVCKPVSGQDCWPGLTLACDALSGRLLPRPIRCTPTLTSL
jgi:DNA-binding response OmpR family regulator